MTKSKNKERKIIKEDKKNDSPWRKPITLDSFEDEDPLAALYQGSETTNQGSEAEKSPPKPKIKASISPVKTKKTAKKRKVKTKLLKPQEESQASKIENAKTNDQSKNKQKTKVSEEELKSLLKIKSNAFQFSDIREILRGKSLDIYAYLLFLSGDSGVCKIKHNDLMKILDISRPTLFKQGSWLEKLHLIKKSSVPGDHTGTSYTVYRLEDVLPISDNVVEQVEAHIENVK